MSARRRPVWALIAAGVTAGSLLLAACGVEVPDDVADDIEDARDETTTTEATPTTEVPTSDDDLEQSLIDNGYTLEEAQCGAENLRERLDDDEIAEIIEADTIEDIGFDTATEFAEALRPCVEDGAEGEGDAEGDDPEPDDPDPDEPDDPDDSRPGGGRGEGQVPDFGDDSDGDVSRSRFLAGLIAAGVPAEAAQCIVDEAYATLDQDELNTLFHSDSIEDVPADLLREFQDIVDGCQG